MQYAAITLHGAHERRQFPPGRQIGWREGYLRVAYALDQHLEIVQATEKILDALQRRNDGLRSCLLCFRSKFSRVAELLQRDADAVQALETIHRAGGLEGRFHTHGAMC